MLARFNRPAVAVLTGMAAAFIFVASPAAAQDSDIVVRGVPEGVNVQKVSYGDLNLRLIAHLEILNERVGSAVKRVCDFQPRETIRGGFGYEDCSKAAWAGARPQIHRAYLRANRLAER